MEFRFNIDSVLKSEITIYKNGEVTKIRDKYRNHEYHTRLSIIVDDMGTASARAQGLYLPITTLSKLIHSKHTLYILKEMAGEKDKKTRVLGILKTGVKRLFLTDMKGELYECESYSVLDFYVHESMQRAGCGKKLFEAMLEEEEVLPGRLAYDRPSHKLLGFLKKHYNLNLPIKQNNNFVVFPSFFHKETTTKSADSIKPCNLQRSDIKISLTRISKQDEYLPKYQAPLQLTRNTFSRYNSFSPVIKRPDPNQIPVSRTRANPNYSWTVSDVYDRYNRHNPKSELFF